MTIPDRHRFFRAALDSVIEGELNRLFHFAVTGVLTAAIYFGGYFILRASTELHATVASTLAFGAAITFQYAGHARFTFRQQLSSALRRIFPPQLY